MAIKFKSRKTKLYPGDNTTQIVAVRENGDRIGIMNLTPYYGDGRKKYENDINGRVFLTIRKAKQYCKENYNQFIN